MKLYYKAGACSLSPHIILREAGLDFSIEAVDLATKKTETGADFLLTNPKGQVPALLLDDGSLLTEGVAIVQYIADQVPDRQLMPAVGSIARYKAIGWLNFVATEMHKGFSPLFNPQSPDAYKAIAIDRLHKNFAYLDGLLATQNYLLGTRFSVADAYLFTVTNWAYALKLDMASYAHISAYQARIAARPAVEAALKAEGLK